MSAIRVEVGYELPEGGEVFISASVELSPSNYHLIEDYRVRDAQGHEVDLDDEDAVFDKLTDDFVIAAVDAWADR